MKLAVVLALAATAKIAHAGAVFDEYGATVRPRPSEQLFEASCDLDLELRGAVATGEIRQRIVNPGPEALAASYQFDLPTGATITGFSIRTDAGTEQALPVPATFNTVEAASQKALGVDPAVLVAQQSGSADYAIRIQPIEPDHEVTVTTRYTALAEVRASALRLVLPGRAAGAKLTACRGTLHALAGPGASIKAIHISGKDTFGASATFSLDASPLPIDAELAFAGNQPVVWTQTQPLVDGWSATLLTVAAPAERMRSPQIKRALFVIDGSRSMELVGRHNVAKVIRTIAGGLPAGTELDAILYDRTARRVFSEWRPPTTENLTALERAISDHAAVNGSDVLGAFRLAHQAIADPIRGITMVISISDGVTGDLAGSTLARALDSSDAAIEVLAIVLDPATTRSPGADALRAVVNRYGGSFIEVTTTALDDALTAVDEWLRPSWNEIAVRGHDVPSSVRAGSGFTKLLIAREAPGKLVLTGHREAPIKIAPRAAPAAPIATLALAAAAEDDFTLGADPDDAERDRAYKLRDRAIGLYPYVYGGVALAVLTTGGRVAHDRHAMVRGGGPYERIVAVADPTDRSVVPGVAIQPTASAIAKITLERLFRDQLQPRAYACYQRALGTSPKLAGTASFEFRMGRGEITEVSVTGLGDPQLEACLLDAAYAIQLPLPNFAVNADDQTVAHYPLTFNVADDRPRVMLGDADSASPLDIDAIPGGVPGKPGVIKVNAATPLGNLRPSH